MDRLFNEIQNAARMIATPNWADKAAILVSIIAVTISGVVAWRQMIISKKQAEIAEQQNHIALFDKRYDIYQLIQKCNHFAWLLYNFASTNEDVCKLYIVATSSIETVDKDIDGFDVDLIATQIMDFINGLNRVEFLFSNKVANYAIDLMAELQLTVTNCLVLEKDDYIKEAKKSLQRVHNRYDAEKIGAKIIEELRLTSNEG